jgi:pyruvate dehydrogenase E2 component (dihydrolipoamide acetyltransferase)
MTTVIDEPAERRPLNRIRKATARAMTAAAAVPQFTLDRTVRADALLELRERRRAAGRDGSVSDFLTAAVARALREHPELNASFDGDAVVIHRPVNVGLAVALEDGLVVACIHDADDRPVADLAAERQRLDAAARANKLKPAELMDATFTISNLGPLGIDRFRAVVLPPQAAILAVGGVRPALVPGSEPPQWGRYMTLTLTCDHRVVDGAPAARFFATLADALEAPAWLEER